MRVRPDPGRDSGPPKFSPDGTAVLFPSDASDLVSGDGDGAPDWFLRDLVRGTTTLLSVDGETRVESNQARFSPDGSAIVLTSGGVRLYDVATGATTLVSVAGDGSGRPGNGRSQTPIFSPDGTKVAFLSHATDLVAQPTTGQGDVFVRDLAAGTTTLVSGVASGGNNTSFAPTFSPDGRRVGFLSLATDLVPVADFNNLQDFFVRDLATGHIELVSVSTAGTAAGQPFLAIFDPPWFLPDGRVLFTSNADDLVPNDANQSPDVFVRDLDADTTELVSVNAAGTASGNGGSDMGRPLPDGRVAFQSGAHDLVPGGTIRGRDIFIRDLDAGTTTLVTERWDGTTSGNGDSTIKGDPQDVASADGRALAFISSAGVPERGSSRTPSISTGARPFTAAATASPMPPQTLWSSTVRIALVSAAAFCSVAASIGLTE